MRDREMLLREARELASSKPTQDAMKAFVAGLEPEEREIIIEEYHSAAAVVSTNLEWFSERLLEIFNEFFAHMASLVERLQELGVLEKDISKGDENVRPHSAG